jgi:hypothetical protein
MLRATTSGTFAAAQVGDGAAAGVVEDETTRLPTYLESRRLAGTSPLGPQVADRATLRKIPTLYDVPYGVAARAQGKRHSLWSQSPNIAP